MFLALSFSCVFVLPCFRFVKCVECWFFFYRIPRTEKLCASNITAKKNFFLSSNGFSKVYQSYIKVKKHITLIRIKQKQFRLICNILDVYAEQAALWAAHDAQQKTQRSLLTVISFVIGLKWKRQLRQLHSRRAERAPASQMYWNTDIVLNWL